MAIPPATLDDLVTGLTAANAQLVTAMFSCKLGLITKAFNPSVDLLMSDLTICDVAGLLPLSGVPGRQNESFDADMGQSLVQVKAPAGGFRWETPSDFAGPVVVYGFALANHDFDVLLGTCLLAEPMLLTGPKQSITAPRLQIGKNVVPTQESLTQVRVYKSWMPTVWGVSDDIPPVEFIASLDPIAWHRADIPGTLRTSAAAGFPARATPPATLSSSSAIFNTGAAANFAWAGWVQWNGVAGISAIVGKGNTDNYEWSLLVNYPAAGLVTFLTYNLTGGGWLATWPTPVLANEWHHIAVWRNVALGTINISLNNGTPIITVTAAPTSIGTAGFRMGNIDDGSFSFGGAIGPCGYWSRALTQGNGSDLEALYNGGDPVLFSSLAGAQSTGCVAYYDMDSVPHLTADRTGGGHTLTNNNVVTLAGGVTQTAIVNGQMVTRWDDSSGHGKHYVTPAGNAGFLYTENVQNGLPMLRGGTGTGDSTDSRMLSCDAMATLISGVKPQYAYFCVIKGLVLTGTFQNIFLAATRPLSGGDAAVDLGYDGTVPSWQCIEQDASESIINNGDVPPDSAYHTVGYVADATHVTLYLDGVVIGTSLRPNGEMAMNIFTLGSHRQFQTDQRLPFTGYIGEDVLFGFAPIGDVLTRVLAYFDSKWLP